MARSGVQILREMALVKTQLKGDPVSMKALLAPLEAELAELVSASQGQLPGVPPAGKPPAK